MKVKIRWYEGGTTRYSPIFDNIFEMLDYCYKYKLSKENSEMLFIEV